MTGAGAIALRDGGKETTALAGHGPPVRQVMLVASGGEAVSADASGVVRVTRVEELRTVGRFDASRLREALRRR